MISRDRRSHERTGGALVWSSFQAALQDVAIHVFGMAAPPDLDMLCAMSARSGAPSPRVMSPMSGAAHQGAFGRRRRGGRRSAALGATEAAGAPVQSSFAETPLLPQHVFEPME